MGNMGINERLEGEHREKLHLELEYESTAMKADFSI
jgi:hypothetical protein